jgi:hypothetical protein
MIGFIIPPLHQLQFTVAHILGFSVSTGRFLATDLDAQTEIKALGFDTIINLDHCRQLPATNDLMTEISAVSIISVNTKGITI